MPSRRSIVISHPRVPEAVPRLLHQRQADGTSCCLRRAVLDYALGLILASPIRSLTPICRLPLTIDLKAPALQLEGNDTMAALRQYVLGRNNIDMWRLSTKIQALVEELSDLRKQDTTAKVSCPASLWTFWT